MFVMGLTQLETVVIWAVFAVAWLGLGYAVFLRTQTCAKIKAPKKCRKFGMRSKMERMLIYRSSFAPSCL